MINILLYISMGLVLFGFVLYFLLIMVGKFSEVSNVSGFDVTKDILSEYDSINVIESKSYFTVYNIKRKVIKLATKCYYGKDLTSISLSLMEAGISIIDDNNNKYINIFRYIFNNLKLLYIFPLLSLFISNSSFYVSDAKVSVFFLLGFVFITYVLMIIREQSSYFVEDNLKKIKEINKDNYLKIIKFMNKLIFCDKLIYFGQLVMIVRLVLIMFKIN